MAGTPRFRDPGPGDQSRSDDAARRQAALLDQARVALLAADAAGRVTLWNRSAAALLGWSAEEAMGQGLRDLLAAPDRPDLADRLLGAAATGRPWEGEARVRRRDGSRVPVHFDAAPIRDPRGAADGVVVTAVDLTGRKAVEARLAHRAFHDPLTGLPNRALFLDRLGHALARAERDHALVAVLFVDLDRFKIVNDGLGHAAGDRLLVAVGRRLAGAVRPADTVARFGGDEFTVVLEGTTQEAATAVAERILAVLRAPFPVNSHETTVGASIGLALGVGGAAQAGDLLRDADVAMYRAKAAGGGGLAVFAPAMNEHALRRLDLEAELRHAVERNELRLRYQPIVDLGTGRVAGLEALLRWAHPERGLIGPADFVPLAEDTGLIVPLGRWALGEACRQAATWPAAAGGAAFVNVNVSARQFHEGVLVAQVSAALEEAGLAPERLRLELTERVLVGDAAGTIGTLGALKGLGVGLAIDDFGTGWASLEYLRRLPVDALKIDRAFVREIDADPASLAIARAVATLGRDLGLGVTAEGIETAAQLAHARAIGCGHGQGFFFAPPLPAAEASALLPDAAYRLTAGDPGGGTPLPGPASSLRDVIERAARLLDDPPQET